MQIIVNKSIKQGVIGSDSSSLNEYFELGWELMVTRIKLIKMLYDGQINRNDIVITTEDRKFLYTKLFDNVYTTSIKDIESVDLVDKCMEVLESNIYDNLSKITNVIQEIDYSDLSNFDVSKNFICMQIRQRSHCPERNGDTSYYCSLFRLLKNKGFNVFVGGKGADKFCDKDFYVEKLRDWFSLVHNKNCLAVCGPTSGLSAGAVILSSTNAKLLVTDPTGISKLSIFGKHPLYYGRCVNFSNMPYKYYLHNPNIDQFINDIYNVNTRLGGPF